MNTDILLSLVSLMLPTDMLTAFNVVKVENDSQRIAIHLEEKIPESIRSVDYYESKGFLDAVTMRDFPIRDKAVDLIVRRRRWLDKRTGKCIVFPYSDYKSEGTRYSREFAAFLKELYGDDGYDLPFA